MNEGLDSTLLSASQTRRNVNVTLRNGAIRPRPKKVELEFDVIGGKEKVSLGGVTFEELFYKGRNQHAGKINTASGEELLLVKSGVSFAVNVKTCKVRIVDVDSARKFANYKRYRVYGHQADNRYVLYDWPNQPIIIDNRLDSRRTSNADYEIPRSYVGTYVHGRTFPGYGNCFAASDVVGNTDPTGTLGIDAPITFIDSFAPNSTFVESPEYCLSYVEPINGITAMGYFQATQGSSGLGYGPLFVSSKESIHVFPVNQPRENWNNGSFGEVYVFNYGIVGPRAHVHVGGDLYYRSHDCQIYSLKRILSDQDTGKYRQISREIDCSIRTTNKDLIEYSTMGFWDNRIFTTLRPSIIQRIDPMGNCIEDVVFNGLGVLELNPASSLGGSFRDVWASIYSGIYTDSIEICGDMYLIGYDKNSKRNTVYRLDEDRCSDFLNGVSVPVKSRVITKVYDHGAPINQKILKYVWPLIRDIKPPFKMTVSFRIKDTCEWTCLGVVHKDCDSERFDTKENFFCPTDGDSCYKCIEIKYDICGSDYSFSRQILVSDVNTEIEPEQEIEKEEDGCFCPDFTREPDLCL